MGAVKAILAALFAMGLAFPAFAQDPASQPAAEGKQLTMYATKWCGYCKKARSYLAARNIPYREVDIEASAANRAEHKALGGKGIPFFVYGERKLRGFSEAAMDRFLASAR